jgi:hypothetical protein
VWVRDTRAGGFITAPWIQLNMVSAPFADFTWRHARSLLAARGADDTNETAIAAAVAQLLDRAETGPDRRIVARARAAASVPLRPEAPAAGDDGQESFEPDQDQVDQVVPFGVFDPFTDGARR